MKRAVLTFVFLTTAAGVSGADAAAPLYRDPILGTARHPFVVWNPHVVRWWLFYARERAKASSPAALGIAESIDGGANFVRAGDAELVLPDSIAGPRPAFAAPEIVVSREGPHHLFVTVTPASPRNAGRESVLAHFTSTDLRRWAFAGTLPFAADADAGIAISEAPGGGRRLWYRNPRPDGAVMQAFSRDLKTWNERGPVASARPHDRNPAAFTWRGRHWLLVDSAEGVSAHRSLDHERWERQPQLVLTRAGAGADGRGADPCVLVNDGRAFCFYTDQSDADATAIQVVELLERDGWLHAATTSPAALALVAPNAPRPRDLPALLERSAADAAQLRAFGSRDIRAHDPSALIECDGEYWIFHTGRGVPSWRSRDLVHWQEGPPVFAQPPAWVAGAVPENRNALFWAPDIIRIGDRYLLYYSVSSFGKKTSAIALATNTTLDPASPAFGWRDEGVVVRSGADTNFNAIDPALFHDRDGRLWMSFGSYWTGLKLLELDPATGQRLAPDSPLHALAQDASIEAAFIHRRDGYYYLFANYGWCCRGVNSSYHIRVGRSTSITGPYLDREGRAMLQGGGTLVLASEGPFIGAGHASIMNLGGREWFGCHFYDATQRGRPGYALRPLSWDAAGWPVVGRLEDASR